MFGKKIKSSSSGALCTRLRSNRRELKHARDADGNRKRTFRVPGQCCLQIFILIISNGEKILSNGNVFVGRQVKRENSSLPLAVRVSKTRVLKLPPRDFKIYDAVVNENATKQQYHWLKVEK